ncbi:MAG: restriction endonuclease subunit S [Hyphomonas sp.]|nr:restriction endonuclease subunit S [Hyphomonas sp.]
MLDWRPSTWGDEIALEYGKAIRGYQVASGKYRVFGTNGSVGWTEKALAQGPGVILGRKGAYRGVHFSEQPFWVIDTAYYVRPLHDELDMRWLYYAIKFNELGNIDDGSPIPSTTRAAVYVRDLDVPKLREQKAIAAVLSALDDKIELNRRMNETLEALAQAIFKDWFVTFGPTRRKMEGATDPVTILGGLIPDPAKAAPLAALFPHNFGEDGLPEGWDSYALEKLASLSKASLSPSKTPDQVFEHHSLPAYDKGEEPVVEKGSAIRSNKFVVPNNAVLLSKLNPEISRVWVPNPSASDPQIASTEFLVLVPKEGVGRSLLCAIFRDPSFRSGLEGMVTGTSKSHQRISPPALMEREIVHGTCDAFRGFDDLAAPLLDKRLALRAENRTLAETRDYLLPKLMSGAVRVRDAYAVAEVDVTAAAPVKETSETVVAFPTDLLGGPYLSPEQDTERDAVMVASIVASFRDGDTVVGNVKVQKGCYFIRRRMGISVQTFEKQAAGPYDQTLNHEGGRGEALSRQWIGRSSRATSSGKVIAGNVPGAKAPEAHALVKHYSMDDAISWTPAKTSPWFPVYDSLAAWRCCDETRKPVFPV